MRALPISCQDRKQIVKTYLRDPKKKLISPAIKKRKKKQSFVSSNLDLKEKEMLQNHTQLMCIFLWTK